MAGREARKREIELDKAHIRAYEEQLVAQANLIHDQQRAAVVLQSSLRGWFARKVVIPQHLHAVHLQHKWTVSKMHQVAVHLQLVTEQARVDELRSNSRKQMISLLRGAVGKLEHRQQRKAAAKNSSRGTFGGDPRLTELSRLSAATSMPFETLSRLVLSGAQGVLRLRTAVGGVDGTLRGQATESGSCFQSALSEGYTYSLLRDAGLLGRRVTLQRVHELFKTFAIVLRGEAEMVRLDLLCRRLCLPNQSHLISLSSCAQLLQRMNPYLTRPAADDIVDCLPSAAGGGPIPISEIRQWWVEHRKLPENVTDDGEPPANADDVMFAGLTDQGFYNFLEALAVEVYPPHAECACTACVRNVSSRRSSWSNALDYEGFRQVHALHVLERIRVEHLCAALDRIERYGTCGASSIAGRLLVNPHVRQALIEAEPSILDVVAYYGTKAWIRAPGQRVSWNAAIRTSGPISLRYVDVMRFAADYDLFPVIFRHDTEGNFQQLHLYASCKQGVLQSSGHHCVFPLVPYLPGEHVHSGCDFCGIPSFTMSSAEVRRFTLAFEQWAQSHNCTDALPRSDIQPFLAFCGRSIPPHRIDEWMQQHPGMNTLNLEDALTLVGESERLISYVNRTNVDNAEFLIFLGLAAVTSLSRPEHIEKFPQGATPADMVLYFMHHCIQPAYRRNFGAEMIRASTPPPPTADPELPQLDAQLHEVLKQVYKIYPNAKGNLNQAPFDATAFELFVGDCRLFKSVDADIVERVFVENSSQGVMKLEELEAAFHVLMRENFFVQRRQQGPVQPSDYTTPIGPNTHLTPFGLAKRAAVQRLHALYDVYRLPARQGNSQEQAILVVRPHRPKATPGVIVKAPSASTDAAGESQQGQSAGFRPTGTAWRSHRMIKPLVNVGTEVSVPGQPMSPSKTSEHTLPGYHTVPSGIVDWGSAAAYLASSQATGSDETPPRTSSPERPHSAFGHSDSPDGETHGHNAHHHHHSRPPSQGASRWARAKNKLRLGDLNCTAMEADAAAAVASVIDSKRSVRNALVAHLLTTQRTSEARLLGFNRQAFSRVVANTVVAHNVSSDNQLQISWQYARQYLHACGFLQMPGRGAGMLPAATVEPTKLPALRSFQKDQAIRPATGPAATGKLPTRPSPRRPADTPVLTSAPTAANLLSPRLATKSPRSPRTPMTPSSAAQNTEIVLALPIARSRERAQAQTIALCQQILLTAKAKYRSAKERRKAEQLAAQQAQQAKERKSTQIIAEGDAQRSVGNIAQAVHSWEQALSLSQDLKDAERMSQVLLRLGLAMVAMEQFESAVSYLEDQVRLKASSSSDLLDGLAGLGDAYLALAQVDRALFAYAQCGGLARSEGDITREGLALAGIGTAFMALGLWSESIDAHTAHLKHSTTHKLANQEAQALSNLGQVLLFVGRTFEGLSYLERELTMRPPGKEAEGVVRYWLGVAHLQLHHYDLAMQSFQRLLSVARSCGDRRWQAMAHYGLGDTILMTSTTTHLRSSQIRVLLQYAREPCPVDWITSTQATTPTFVADAMNAHHRGLEVWKTLGDTVGVVRYLAHDAWRWYARGEYGEALRVADKFLSQSQSIHGNRLIDTDRLAALYLQAVCQICLAKTQLAISALHQCLDAAKTNGNKLILARAHSLMGRILSAQHQSESMQAAIGHLVEAARLFHEVQNHWGEAIAVGDLADCYLLQAFPSREAGLTPAADAVYLGSDFDDSVLAIMHKFDSLAGSRVDPFASDHVHPSLPSGSPMRALVQMRQSVDLSSRTLVSLAPPGLTNPLSPAHKQALARAIELYSQAQFMCIKVGNRMGAATMNAGLGTSYLLGREIRKSLDHWTQALETYTASNYLVGQMSGFEQMGIAYASLTCFKEAVACFESQRRVAEEANKPHHITRSMRNLELAYAAHYNSLK